MQRGGYAALLPGADPHMVKQEVIVLVLGAAHSAPGGRKLEYGKTLVLWSPEVGVSALKDAVQPPLYQAISAGAARVFHVPFDAVPGPPSSRDLCPMPARTSRVLRGCGSSTLTTP